MIINGEKICGHCRNWKKADQFGNCKASEDGLYYICKLCKREYDRYYYAANKERIKEQAYKLRYRDHEGYKQYLREWQRKNANKKNK